MRPLIEVPGPGAPSQPLVDYSQFLRGNQPEKLEMPTGWTAKVKWSGILVDMRTGSLPTKLDYIAKNGLSGIAALEAHVNEMKTNVEYSTKFSTEYWEGIVCACFVEPKFSMTPEPGEFHPHDLDLRDFRIFANWAVTKMDLGGAGSALESFRTEQGRGAAAGTGGENVGVSPESVSADGAAA